MNPDLLTCPLVSVVLIPRGTHYAWDTGSRASGMKKGGGGVKTKHFLVPVRLQRGHVHFFLQPFTDGQGQIIYEFNKGTLVSPTGRGAGSF